MTGEFIEIIQLLYPRLCAGVALSRSCDRAIPSRCRSMHIIHLRIHSHMICFTSTICSSNFHRQALYRCNFSTQQKTIMLLGWLYYSTNIARALIIDITFSSSQVRFVVQARGCSAPQDHIDVIFHLAKSSPMSANPT